jgi:enoyl-CoA hydratase/carnithine racemase
MNAAREPASPDAAFTVDRRDALEIVTLDRPDTLNAISEEMATGLRDYFGDLHSRTDIRVVILRAAGRAFCAGLDIKGWAPSDGATPVLHSWRTQNIIGDIVRRMRSCPQPIVALGHGAACGGGMSLLLASDIRVGAPSLRMNAAYIRIGLTGCDIASSYLLPRLVGSGIASELILTGRFLSADRALRLGLLSDIVEESALLESGLSFANDMLATSPYGLRLSKQALNINIDAPGLEAAMALEDRQQVMLAATCDHAEAMAAFIEKRQPDYRGQ